MKAYELLEQIEKRGIHVVAGVPDSTLKQFCDGLKTYQGNLRHYVPANEGAAVGIAVGSFLASGKPACVYMQNSGIGNIVNPLTSLANIEVYGIPILFIVGWRGESGVKDEPQHVFQGRITCTMFDTLEVPYAVIDKNTTISEMMAILEKAWAIMESNRQFAIIVKKDTFEPDEEYAWTNGNLLVREQVLSEILKTIPREALVIATTGKISRELYDQSNRLFGNHENIFMSVGGMGHASMIALGIAEERPEKQIVCIDGDGAALMHMGALPFIASRRPQNFTHIIINNKAHESVGAMPTGCQKADFVKIAKASGYKDTYLIQSYDEICLIKEKMNEMQGPILFEVPVTLASRADLCRPRETAGENKLSFMEYLKQ